MEKVTQAVSTTPHTGKEKDTAIFVSVLGPKTHLCVFFSPLFVGNQGMHAVWLDP